MMWGHVNDVTLSTEKQDVKLCRQYDSYLVKDVHYP